MEESHIQYASTVQNNIIPAVPQLGSNGNFYTGWDENCIKVIYSNLYNEEGFIPTTSTTIVEHVGYQPAEVSCEPKSVEKTKTKGEGIQEPQRQKKGGVAESRKDVVKKARNSGKMYEKLKGKGKGGVVEEKEIGPDCFCPNKCFEKVGEDIVHKIFKDFWALGDYNSQNAYLFGLINMKGVKRRYTKNKISRRNFTITYCVKKKGQNIAICKKAFLNVHGLQKNRGRINNLATKMKEGESVPPPDKRGRHTNRPNAYSDEAIEHVVNHLKICPKFTRKKNTGKPSKQMEFSTKKCYDLYVNEYCKRFNLMPVSLDKYRRIYWEEGYRSVSVLPKKSTSKQTAAVNEN